MKKQKEKVYNLRYRDIERIVLKSIVTYKERGFSESRLRKLILELVLEEKKYDC